MIEFKMADWRTNACILGLIRILEHNNLDYKAKANSIEIDSEILKGFEEYYFSYFSDSYEKSLPWYRIVSYDKKLTENLEDYKKITKNDLDILDRQIDIVKDYLKRNNYVKIYDLIDGGQDLEEKVENINKVNMKDGEKIRDRIEDILEEMGNMKEIIDICKTEDARKHMRAKGVIYSHINRNLEGVAFLNRNTKHIDVFEDYKEYFVSPLLKEMNEKKEGKKAYECFSCGNTITNLKNSYNMNLLSKTGFDDKRKTSYTWNHMSDILICHKCNFLYSMISAGFNHSDYESLFVNYNRNIEGLRAVNNDARNRLTYLDDEHNKIGLSYRTIVSAISKEYIDELEYKQYEIQTVRYKDEEYIFNMLSTESIGIIKNSKEYLEDIEKIFYVDNKEYVSIYDLVLDRIFNNENLFNLMNFLSLNRISKNSIISGNYNFYYISKMNSINYEILKGGTDMDENKVKDHIYFSRLDGDELRQEYLKSGNEKKISGLTYRLLNALKTKNAEEFLNNVLNAYMYLGEPVPENVTIVLEGEEELGLVGYSFVAGLNGGWNRKR